MSTKAQLCSRLGATYWERGSFKRYYFNYNELDEIICEDPASTIERKRFLKNQASMGKEVGTAPKVYYDIVKDKFGHTNCPDVCAVVENYMVCKIEGLDDESRYENGVLKELLDDD